MAKGLYIHVPFCRHKCLYCDFYSVPLDERISGPYVDVLLRQISGLDNDFSTIYIGGGTPSVLGAGLLDKLLRGLERFIKKDTEVTIEVNPESADREKLGLFIDRGVNRISIGAQSFDDRKLKSLGRIHSAGDAKEAIGLSKKTGFKNISIDMIFGVSGEGPGDWQDELEKAAGFGVQHVSCYSLSYEKDTPLFRMREERRVAALDEEAAAEMYLCAIDYLPKMGFRHYEVSNFSKPGFECRHNLNYWDNGSYVGLGPSGVSYIDGGRYENVRDVKEYIDRYERGADIIMRREKLSGIGMARETAALKIRTRQGISCEWFKNKTGYDFLEIEKEALESLYVQDLIKSGSGSTFLSEKGFLFADTVSAAFL